MLQILSHPRLKYASKEVSNMEEIENLIEEAVAHLEDLSVKLESDNYDEMLKIAGQVVYDSLAIHIELKKEREKYDRER